MPDAVYGLRPEIEEFEYAGCRVRLIGAAEILAAAATRRVELLHGQSFPPPVRQVRFCVASGPVDGRPGYLLEAEVRTGAPAARAWPESSVLGNDPLGVLLARRIAAGDKWATRVVSGVGSAVAEVSRRLGLDQPDPTPATADEGDVLRTVRREDEGTGLAATVTYRAQGERSRSRSLAEESTPPAPQSERSRSRGPAEEVSTPPTALDGGPAQGGGRAVTIRATVPAEQMSARHLAAGFGVVLDVVRELVGEQAGGARAATSQAGDATSQAGGAAAASTLAARSYLLTGYPMPDPSTPDTTALVTLDQVGGLGDVVAQFRQIAVSFRHPHAMARWGARRPQGILMYGPPGTGKTMLARALANEIGAEFREIRTPEILDKWLGASERNIKRIFREAHRYRQPTVMLFDEFDSIISYAGAGQDAASQAVSAVAGIFKQEMNNLVEHNPNVIVVATTNFPHRVDDSLIRSGRFDIKLAIPVPDQAGRAEIITKMIRQLIAAHEVAGFRMFADDVDVRALAAASHGMTGADIREVLRRAQLAKAMQEARTSTPPAPISQRDLTGCIAELHRAEAGVTAA